MKIDYLLLCDKATVRDGLLHVLGGGIQVLWRDRVPAPMAIDLVISLSAPAADLKRPHRIEMSVKSHDNQMTVAEAELHWESAEVATATEGIDTLVPLIVPLGQVGLPAFGHYTVNVRVDGKAARRVDFFVKPATELEAFRARSSERQTGRSE